MGLFDKKYCDICSAKIGLLGNRKLEDGNMCKECASKLSPLFNERRSSTVEEIKEQLAYREENKTKLNSFNPDMCFGESKKIYVDIKSKKFIVTSTSKWREYNPDIIDFSQIINIETNIEEDKEEIYYKDEAGHDRSYNPPRYICEYLFMVTMYVNSPWFDKIELELSDGNRPDSPYTDLYRKYEKDFHSIKSVLTSKEFFESDNQKTNLISTLSDAERKEIEELANMNLDANNDASINANLKNEVKLWKCEYCGTENSGDFCINCGALH